VPVLRYVWRELIRNPRRTLASLVGLTLGVALFSGVLFFIQGSSASMTSRALAPLAVDMQRVLTNPLGGGLKFTEHVSPTGELRPGRSATVTLRIENQGPQAVHEVVVNDQPPSPLTYVPGTTMLNGKLLPDKGGQSPLAQGLARSGINLGTVAPNATVTLTYRTQSHRRLPSVAALKPRGTISTRENVVPTPANSPQQLSLAQLTGRIARIPGVAAADGLSFVDLPPGSLSRGGKIIRKPVRVFGFDHAYQRHYPSIRIFRGTLGRGSAALSVEASRALGAAPGSKISLSLPGKHRPLTFPVGAEADLSQARPLFYSRNSTKLEDFLYVPDSVIVSPATFANQVIPAFQAASAQKGAALKSPPVQEVDVLVDRSRLHSDPSAALDQTKAIAQSVKRIAPGQDYLIDNISNTLKVASDDAALGRRMFLFLGLPGVLLAAFLAAYAGSILAGAQRRERANLRLRGADRGHLGRMLLYRTLAFASAGSLVGAALGFVSVLVILGSNQLLAASFASLLITGLLAAGIGMATTAVAMYVPGRRSLGHEVHSERAELAISPVPAWRRWHLDLALLAVGAIAEVVALRAGAFDAPPASVYVARPSSLPTHLMLAPLGVWIGGMLLSARVFDALVRHARVPAPPHYGPLLRGTLTRSLKRRPWVFVTGVVGVGLVIAFGASLSIFAATYDAAKAADARLTVGSDIKVTPSPLSPRNHPPGFASALPVPGVAAVSPVTFKPENTLVYSKTNQDVKDMAAIDPHSFAQVAPMSDSLFVGRSAASAMAALRTDPRAVLVDRTTADDLSINTADRIKVLLARGTKHQVLKTFHVAGLFRNFPGFPQGTNLVGDLGYYDSATGTSSSDFFLVRSTDQSSSGIATAAESIRSGPGRHDALHIETTGTALNKDQSSLTALNVNGLVGLDSFYTLLMAATAIAIFVFGLMLQRRREYVILLAQGMRTVELQVLVLAEAALIALCALVAGLLVGTGTGYLLARVLQPLFILKPALTVPAGQLATLGALAGGATLVAAAGAVAMLRRLRPIELLREE
jgi:putative ABC transport system permease protein